MQEALEARFGPRPGGRGRGSGGGGGGGSSSAHHRDAADLWDDPDPETFHGNRQLGQMNWQQAEMTSAMQGDAGPNDALEPPTHGRPDTLWQRGRGGRGRGQHYRGSGGGGGGGRGRGVPANR